MCELVWRLHRFDCKRGRLPIEGLVFVRLPVVRIRDLSWVHQHGLSPSIIVLTFSIFLE